MHSSRGRRHETAFAEALVYPGAEVAGASSTDQIRFRDGMNVGVRFVHIHNMSGMLCGIGIRREAMAPNCCK